MNLKSCLLPGCLAGLVFVSAARAEKPLALVNGDFEQQLTGWSATGDNGMSAAVAVAAHSGKLGLRVTDASDTLGSSVATAKFPAVAGKTYAVRFASRVITGNAIGVYLRNYAVTHDTVTRLRQIVTISTAFERFSDNAALAPHGLGMRIHFTADAEIKKKAEVDTFKVKVVVDTHQPIGVIVTH